MWTIKLEINLGRKKSDFRLLFDRYAVLIEIGQQKIFIMKAKLGKYKKLFFPQWNKRRMFIIYKHASSFWSLQIVLKTLFIISP